MTVVTGALLVGGGVAPANANMLAHMTVAPFAPTNVTAGLLLPPVVPVAVAADGTWSVDCEPLPAGYAYVFKAVLGGGAYVYTRTVTVPAAGPVQFKDLPDVVPATATAFAPPAWADEILVARTAAADSATAAATSATDANAAKVAVEGVVATTDGLMEAVRADPASAFTIGQNATIASEVAVVGDDKYEAQRKRKLRRFWEALAANNASVLIPGDSWTEGTRGSDLPWLRWVDHLATAIRSVSPQAQGGIYIPAWATYATRIPANFVFTGTVTNRDQTGIGFYNTEMAVGATATLTLRGTGFKMHMDRRTDGATVEVRIDGVLVETYNSTHTSLSTGDVRVYGGYPLGVHTLQLTVTAATGAIFSLQGAYVFNVDETSGVRVYPSGRGGITAYKYFETANFAGQLANAAPDLVIFGLGINDYRTAVTVANFKTRLSYGVQLIKDRAQWATDSLVFLQFPQPAIGGTPAVAAWEEYRQAVAEVSAASGGLLIDLAELFAPGQLDDTSALVNVDEVHVNDPGHVAVAAKIAEHILPAKTVESRKEERLWVPAANFGAQDGAPIYGVVNSTFPAWRLLPDSDTSVMANQVMPPHWGSCAIDLWYCNFTVGTGVARLRSRIGKMPLGAGVSVSNDDYKNVTAKGQFIVDRSYAHNGVVTLAPDTILRLFVARQGADPVDTLPNDLVFIGVMLRRLS